MKRTVTLVVVGAIVALLALSATGCSTFLGDPATEPEHRYQITPDTPPDARWLAPGTVPGEMYQR